MWRRRDTKIDEAKQALMAELFDARSGEVFYGRQIEVLFEKKFFHWITTRALGELVAQGIINSIKESLVLVGAVEIRFYWSKRNRYWKRPKNYIETVRRAGGFTLIFEYQLYPHGSAELARRVREELGFRVDSPRAIWEGTLQRLLKWHMKQLAGE